MIKDAEMNAEKREQIRSWLDERVGIYSKYADSIGAKYIGDDRWTVHINGLETEVSQLFRGNEKFLGLLVNYAYYCGASDALYGFGIMHE